jgi:hypothetical protein
MAIVDEPVTGPAWTKTYDVTLESPGFLRAELYIDRDYFMTALTSPIYSRGLAPRTARTRADQAVLATYGDPHRHRDSATRDAARRRHAGCGC